MLCVLSLSFSEANTVLTVQLYKGRINATSHLIQHPMYGAGHKYRTLHLPISTTLAEVLDRVSGMSLPEELEGGVSCLALQTTVCLLTTCLFWKAERATEANKTRQRIFDIICDC